MIIRFSLAVILGWLFASCSNHVEPIVGQAPYFKLNQWLIQESEHLKQNQLYIKRILKTDQTIAEAPTDSNNWEDWFKPLSECDLSKPAYHGFYQVDTVMNQDSSVVTYRALKKETVVKRLELVFVNSKPVKISAQKTVNNLLYHSDAQILYEKDSRYEVDYLQSTRFFDEHHFKATYILHNKK